MIWLRIRDANTVLGRDQAWGTLHARHMIGDFGGDIGKLAITKVALEPTPEELKRLIAGEPLILSIVGDRWPPVDVQVGDNGA
jgi:hypothetical protein